MSKQKKCPMCKHETEEKESRIEWHEADRKDSVGFHWMKVLHVEGKPRFVVSCPYGENVITLIRDILTKKTFKYEGGFAEAGRIANHILDNPPKHTFSEWMKLLSHRQLTEKEIAHLDSLTPKFTTESIKSAFDFVTSLKSSKNANEGV